MSKLAPKSPPYLIHRQKGAGLWMMPAPVFCGTIEETLSHCARAGVVHLASLVEIWERDALGLEGLDTQCKQSNLQLHIFELVDRQPPQELLAFIRFAALLTSKLSAGEGVGIHCKSGIGRSGMLAAAILGQAGFVMDEALAMIERHRGLQAPNTQVQLDWLARHWNAISGKQG